MSTVSNRDFRWTFVLDEPVRVLVVDDDPILREFASVHLSSPCATIDTVGDVASARLQLHDNAYDIVLLDIEMPQVDGFALLQEIRASEKLKHLPVIMLTGHDDIVSIDRAYQTGANSFATKPVNWRLLSYQVRYVMRTSGKPPGDDFGEAEADVYGFLQAVIHRADALSESLSGEDREQQSAALQDLRAIAERAIESARRSNPPDDAPRAGTSKPKMGNAA